MAILPVAVSMKAGRTPASIAASFFFALRLMQHSLHCFSPSWERKTAIFLNKIVFGTFLVLMSRKGTIIEQLRRCIFPLIGCSFGSLFIYRSIQPFNLDIGK